MRQTRRFLVLCALVAIGGAGVWFWAGHSVSDPDARHPASPLGPTSIGPSPAPSVVPQVSPTPPPAPTMPPEATPTPAPTPTPRPTPLPLGTVADRIRVRKQARELTLFRGTQELRTYRVALGFSPSGHKQFEGDGRTPEGRYFINWRNPRSDFHLSLKVSYPNRADAAAARAAGRSPGGEIFIHGLPNGSGAIGDAHRQRDWTAGCVAVTNEEIEEIWRVVPDGCAIDLEP